jgi:quercetin dioxygenase-like cupin family protein
LFLKTACAGQITTALRKGPDGKQTVFMLDSSTVAWESGMSINFINYLVALNYRCAKLPEKIMGVKRMVHNKEQTGMGRLVAQVIRLTDLADYQEGSVVSRTIIDKKTGTVTFFAFDEGQGLSEHTAPFDALVYLLEGEAEIVISGKPIRLKEGEMIIMPANQPHALKALKNFKMILTMIRS